MMEYSKISKRERNIFKSKSLNESTTFSKKKKCFFLYERALDSINRNLSSKKNDVEKFLNTCVRENVVDELYPKCIYIMEKVSDDENLLNISSNIFSKEMIYQIPELASCKNSILGSDLPIVVKEKILESIKENKISDRIINNNINISKKYDIGKYISEHSNLSIDRISKHYCTIVETFKVPTYGKMNIVLEQISYTLDKNGRNYNKDDVAYSVLEYFMLSREVSKDDMESFTKILENYSGYTIHEEYKGSNISIEQMIFNFTMYKDKNAQLLIEMIRYIVDNKSMCDVASNLHIILNLFKNLLLFTDMISINDVSNYCTSLSYDGVYKPNIKYDDAKLLADNFHLFYNNTGSYSINNDLIKEYINILKYSYNRIKDYLPECEMYQRELDVPYQEMKENSDILTLKEFKIFKFQNLISAVIQTDKFIARKNLKIKKVLDKKISVLYNNSKKFFTEATEDDILKYVSEDNYFEICLGVYESLDKNDIKEIHEAFKYICEYMNAEFKDKTYRILYEYNDNIFSLYLKDSTYINLNESETILKESLMDGLDFSNSVFILDTADKLEKIYNVNIEKIIPDIHSLIESGSEYSLEAIKLLAYSGLDSSYIINRECKNIFNEDFNLSNRLNIVLNEANEIQDSYIPLEVRTESVILLNQIINEEVNLNSIKLAMEGLKKKVVDLGSKEQEFSRNLDATVNHFVQSMQNALTNDRREAIIKGSVIPSFSKCIKYAIVIAGIGVVTQGVIIPVIVAFCGLALSAKISVSERSLLLDEIDIELKALEKEIQMAEDARNMKKYRALLTYQKKLQREKQRIRYNLKTGQQLPDKN